MTSQTSGAQAGFEQVAEKCIRKPLAYARGSVTDGLSVAIAEPRQLRSGLVAFYRNLLGEGRFV